MNLVNFHFTAHILKNKMNERKKAITGRKQKKY